MTEPTTSPEKAPLTLAKKLSHFQEMLPERVRSAFADLVIEAHLLDEYARDLGAGWEVVQAVAHAGYRGHVTADRYTSEPHPTTCLGLTDRQMSALLAHLSPSAFITAGLLCDQKPGAVEYKSCRPGGCDRK